LSGDKSNFNEKKLNFSMMIYERDHGILL